MELWWSMWLKTGLNTNIPGGKVLCGEKECKEMWRRKNHERVLTVQKEYRGSNREALRKKGREYREKNRHRINESILCECGRPYTRSNKVRHLRIWHLS